MNFTKFKNKNFNKSKIIAGINKESYYNLFQNLIYFWNMKKNVF